MFKYLNFTKIPDLNTTIHVNLIFIGENIKNAHEKYLHHWFEHLDHIVKASIAKYYDFDEIKTTELDIKTHISYEAMTVPQLVQTVIEQNLDRYLRPDISVKRNDGHFEPDRFVMPTLIMENLFDSFLRNVSRYYPVLNSYTLFILNTQYPRIPAGSIYGYRNGFTRPELITILEELRNPSSKIYNPFIERDLEYNFEDKGKTIKPSSIVKEALKHKNHDEKMSFNIGWNDLETVSLKWAEEESKKGKSTPTTLIHTIDLILNTENYKTEKEELLDDLKHLSFEVDSGITQNGIHTDCLVDLWVSRKRFGWIDLNAGPFSWGDIKIGDGIRSHLAFPRTPDFINHKDNVDYSKIKQEYIYIKPEITKIKDRIQQLCSGNVNSDACETMRKSVSDIIENENYTSKLLTHIMYEQRHTKYKDYDITTISQLSNAEIDFYSRLGTIVNAFVKQVVLPPYSPSYNHKSLLIPTRIMYVITVIKYQKDYDIFNLIDGGLNIEKLKTELKNFHLPNQEVSINIQQVFIDKDTELGITIEKSIKRDVLTEINSKGEYETHTIKYIDSSTIAKILKNKRFSYDSSGNTKVITIFILSVSQDEPLLIDKHHLAVSLQNSILSIQNKQLYTKSTIECNKRVLYWSLRNPISHILRAVGSVVGSLVPTSVKFDTTHKLLCRDWLWSTGDSPMSYLSSHPKFSTINIDNEYRSTIHYILSKSKYVVNKADELLTFINMDMIKPSTLKNFTVTFRDITNLREEINIYWNFILIHSEMLDFSEAIEHINPLMLDVQQYLDFTTELYDKFHIHICKFSPIQITSAYSIMTLIIICVIIILSLFRNIRSYFIAPKIRIY